MNRPRRSPRPARFLPAVLLALALLAPRPADAQHIGLGFSLNTTRYDNNFSSTSVLARGWGVELIGGGIDDNTLYGFASLDFYTVEPGASVKEFGVWNVGFKIWPKAFDPGLRPWGGAAIGLGGGDRQITPVLLTGLSWMRPRAKGLPFVSAEYATKYQRARFKIGYMLGQ